VTDGLEYLGRARMQGLVLLVVVLLAGVLAGAAGDRLLSRGDGPARHGPPRFGPPHGPPGPGRGLPEILDRIDLSDAQRDAVDSLLRAYRPRSEAILRTVLPQLRAQSDSLRAAVRSLLSPAQQRAFDREVGRHPRGDFGPPPFPPRGPGGPPPGFPPPPPPDDGRGPPPPPP